MGRRKVQWKYNAGKVGGVDKLIPQGAKGTGEWLTKGEIPGRTLPMPSRGSTEGRTCTKPMGTRKEQLVRQWAKQS